MHTFDLPTSRSEREQFVKGMLPRNVQLLTKLYGSIEHFFGSSQRKEPMESWILRYDNVIGFTPDILALCDEIGVSFSEDPRVELWFWFDQNIKNT